MDQAEPQPLPGQPERPALGGAVPGGAEPGGAEPGGAVPGGAVPGGAEPGGAQPDGPQPRRPAGVPPPGADCGPPADPRREPLADTGPATDLDHPVVVGYDGSGSSRHALAYAVGMARRLGRPLLVAYITSPSIFCEPLSGQVIAPVRDLDETHRWLLAELDEVCDREGLDVHIVTRQGSPARELAAAADEFGADALVIGAPGRIWHQVAGSVPGWLARHAHCPVIVVP
jgi:nucleotide-binding universal stress UspA family protein